MTQVDLNKKTSEWRTQATHDRYMEVLKTRKPYDGCRLCDEVSLVDFKYWKVLPAAFPYDKIASTHHMILPLRHTTGEDLSSAELEELHTLKKGYLNDNYYLISEALPKRKTIPSHFHLHLFVPRND